ncbi:thioredoxin domain-containing protein 15 [Diorhabda carinulata]|uniref:thioredoxin domain-containing protein 15 n=1 Tax=Diorhabda carinulata TaxID=1163345 RepID=UPI00259FFB5C|nr:thioredoxin domain-containing protein 15 [Diorhabda carinulata]
MYIIITIVEIFLIGVVTSNVNNEKNSELSLSNEELQSNVSLAVNETVSNTTINVNKTQRLVQCLPGMGDLHVQLTNDTELIKLLQPDPKITERDEPGLCVVVLFYSKHCPFSTMAAPHFNALPRAFPDVKMVAINAMMYHLFNTQNGIVGVPSLLLFHNGRSIGKFNGSEYTLEKFSQFIHKHTGISAEESVAVTSADFSGPVTNVSSKDYDLFLILSWLFIIFCAGYYFTKSKWYKWIIEAVQSNWRESEVHAQHEHLE